MRSGLGTESSSAMRSWKEMLKDIVQIRSARGIAMLGITVRVGSEHSIHGAPASVERFCRSGGEGSWWNQPCGGYSPHTMLPDLMLALMFMGSPPFGGEWLPPRDDSSFDD